MWNPALKDLSGLSGLRVIHGDLVLSGNKALTSLAPLGKVRNCGDDYNEEGTLWE